VKYIKGSSVRNLVIGNKNYSSWSLRPWLLMKVKDVSFNEIKIPLYIEGSKRELLKYSPSGKVPALEFDGTSIWDSLAICEYIADVYPEKGCWPANINDRALARSISNEMHSGFFAIRNILHMNCRKAITFKSITDELNSDIARICEIWRFCRQQYSRKGKFLFGEFTIADAMYAPIVLRFTSYGIEVGEIEREYMNNILSITSLQEWILEGIQEKEHIAASEVEA